MVMGCKRTQSPVTPYKDAESMWSEQLMQYKLNGISANQAAKMFGMIMYT